ncbi:DUF4238 domain-containing protein [Enterobacter roggenkampii]|uniref:DUF4238 domain-containing protein n=1 Tax=Enterobacter roggenkampii TaxID=1812935 RepID=UPI0020062D3C|nr:DUF4238 domain-containing protein [Enterobacter roggenkampii]MCK7047671.1 DUF4238 domain-containing protein [Enterobacter roggenkampii]
MGKGSFQIYQHYLPATYIRSFTTIEAGGKETVWGFVKKEASKDQVFKRYVPLNIKKICGADFRHTIWLQGERDNIIEDLFGMLEKTYPDIKSILNYYSLKKDLYNKICPKGYFLFKPTPPNNIIKTNNKPYKLLSGFYEIDDAEIKNLTIFLSQFLCRRLKKIDNEISHIPSPKMKDISNIIKKTIYSNNGLLPEHYNIINKNDWKELLKTINDGSKYLPLSERKTMRDFRNTFSKFYRYLVYPFTSHESLYKNVNVFVFRPPINHSLISCDFPFFQLQKKSNEIDFTEDCIFTLSPHMALLFTSKKRPNVKNVKGFSDLICESNVNNAEKYIFSNELERLQMFTKHLTPVAKKIPQRKNI